MLHSNETGFRTPNTILTFFFSVRFNSFQFCVSFHFVSFSLVLSFLRLSASFIWLLLKAFQLKYRTLRTKSKQLTESTYIYIHTHATDNTFIFLYVHLEQLNDVYVSVLIVSKLWATFVLQANSVQCCCYYCCCCFYSQSLNAYEIYFIFFWNFFFHFLFYCNKYKNLFWFFGISSLTLSNSTRSCSLCTFAAFRNLIKIICAIKDKVLELLLILFWVYLQSKIIFRLQLARVFVYVLCVLFNFFFLIFWISDERKPNRLCEFIRPNEPFSYL